MFEDFYQDLNYQMAFDPVQPATMLMYNPESIVRVALMMTEQQIEFLLASRRYDEAIALLDANRKVISPRHAYLV
jgi:hypothetical protein